VRRRILWSIAAVTVASACGASAATLGGIGSTRLGAGDTPVTPCDSDFTETYTTSGGNVASVLIAGIADPACEGGALSVRLTNSAGDSVASGGPVTVTTDGDTADNAVSVSMSPQTAAENVANIHVSVVGP
jgi:hypothetical protein